MIHYSQILLFPFILNLHNIMLFHAIDQVRRGSKVSNEEILGFAKLFNDELTLDNISRLITFFKHHL